MLGRFVAIALLANAALACADLPSSLPDRAAYFEPPPIYRVWWRQVETCSGLRGNFDDVTFFRVEDAFSFEFQGDAVTGLYQPGPHRITVAGISEDDGRLVRHEMLHALIRRLGHQNEYFKDRCAYVVVCGADCSRDTGLLPPPASDAIEANPSFLELSVSVSDEARSRSWLGHTIPVTVRIRNPSSGHIYVRQNGTNALIMSLLNGGGGFGENTFRWSGPTISFRPFETKIGAFDMWIGPITSGVPLGMPVSMPTGIIEHQVRFSFAGRWSPISTFESLP